MRFTHQIASAFEQHLTQAVNEGGVVALIGVIPDSASHFLWRAEVKEYIHRHGRRLEHQRCASMKKEVKDESR